MSRYAFAANFVRGRRVLDFGCGAGYGCALLSAAGARAVIGNDIAFEAAQYGRDQFGDERTHFAVADCLYSSFRSGSVDVVVSFEAIEHVPSYVRFLAEARRVLAPDGLLIISTPNKKTYSDETVKEDNPFHAHEFYFEEFKEVLAEHFAAVKLYGQTVAEGPFFSEIGAPVWDRTARLVSGGEEGAADPSTHDFFLALCATQTLPVELEASSHYFHRSTTNELHRLRRTIQGLQAEFDRRMSWAMEVERKLAERSEQLLRLQHEFDERTLWALRLNTEVAEANAARAELQAEIDKAKNRLQTELGKVAALEDRVFELEAEVVAKDDSIRRLGAETDLKRDS